jgi:hypothetical protein
LDSYFLKTYCICELSSSLDYIPKGHYLLGL